ncbi:CoA transferase [Arthrobacter sp. I2-34]|uniref:CoA transferase n=1 Tax=Arthrobacter hankyongi TaxID=2904801 RepID=A0ABS9L3P2_9MICC|nr:CoA transferase [Arthrobacter hankyongi]MCG2621301.1 CoA transferase [Arthrobacter hankyongi]
MATQSRRGFSSPAELTVVDLGTGMGAALCAKMLAEAGMTVHRFAPQGDEVFDAIYPAHRGWRSGAIRGNPEDLEDRLAAADICIVGGEDHPEAATRRDAAEISRRHPHLVVLDLAGYVPGFAPDAPAVDLLVQARSGMVAEQYSDRPLCFAVPFPTYGQAMLAVLGAWTALIERLQSARGQVVTASLQQGAALLMLPFWVGAERPDAEFAKVTPKDVQHLIFRCKDGTFIQFVMGVPSAVQKLYRILDIPVEADPADRGIPKVGTPVEKFFGDRPLIAQYVARKNRAEILAAALAVGLPAGPVLEPGEFWTDEQLAANGILDEREDAVGVGSPFGISGLIPGNGPRQGQPTGPAPLSGIRVLDLGSYVAGPFTSRLLADLGATVIKVEGLGGDPNRGLQRHFLACQAGKQDMVIDLKSAAGAGVMQRLLASTDVVTHNFRLGVAERLGLAPEDIRRRQPQALTLHTMSFGPEGPRAKDPGFDMVIQAMVGLERRAGGPGNDPLWYRTPYLDYVTGTLGAVGVLMAIYEQKATGSASDVWVSLLNAGMFLMSDLERGLDGGFRGIPELDAERLGTHPAERLYRTADGWIAVVARNEQSAGELWWRATGDPVAPPRQEWGDPVASRLAGIIVGWTTEQAVHELSGDGVWVEECRFDGLVELRDSPAAREALLYTSRPDGRYGRIMGPVGPLVSFSRTSLSAEGLGGTPESGAHTAPILKYLGYTDGEIDDLYRASAVR